MHLSVGKQYQHSTLLGLLTILGEPTETSAYDIFDARCGNYAGIWGTKTA